MSMGKPIVIVGGGISALLAATLIRRTDTKSPVYVVEQSAELGGLLGKIDGGPFGRFDYGMHTMTDTGIPELDELFWALLPEDEWHVFSGKLRDISGAFYRGALQVHTHYPDVRSLGQDLYQRCLADFFVTLRRPEAGDATNMREYGRARFGPLIASEVVDPIVSKTYRLPAERIDTLAAKLLPLDRVALFDEVIFKDLMAAPALRARIAYPEQRNLDLEYSSGLGSYYPKDFGIHRVIDAMEDRLVRVGVTVLKQTRVLSVSRGAGRIDSIKLGIGNNVREITDVAHLYWTAGLVPLSRQLGVYRDALAFDAPITTAIVNFLFDRPVQMADLYYFYCLDAPHPTYRVTNYSGYCPGAPRAGGFPLCVEMLLGAEAATDASSCEALALSELGAFGVLEKSAKSLYTSVKVLERGFPLPSLTNTESLDAIRNGIRALELRNLTALSILSEPGLFFQTDVVQDVFRKVTARTHA
jgi:protoporphyrinogen oxidase